MDVKYLREMDIDWDAIADTVGIMARMLGPKKTIGTERIIETIGQEKMLDTILTNLTREQIEKIIQQIDHIKSRLQRKSD